MKLISKKKILITYIICILNALINTSANYYISFI